MAMPVVTDASQALLTSLAVFLAAIPAILGAIVILVIGWIVSSILGRLVTSLLRRVRFDQLAAKSGVTDVLARSNVQADPAGVVGGLVKWYIRLVFILMAANAVGITAIAVVVNQILAFIPNLLVAALILAAFAWLANIARNFVGGAVESAGMPNGSALGTIAYVTVFAFGIIAAADQIGIAQTLLNTLFIGVVAALAIAFGLAFGLGGREAAAEIWADWRGHATEAMKAVESNDGSSEDGTVAKKGRTREQLARLS
jgi:hypothetical protein